MEAGTSPDDLSQASTAERWLRRLAELSRRRGLAIGTMLGAARPDLDLLLASAGLHLPAEEGLGEREASERLRDFLASTGAMIDTDPAELRRWLVDLGFVERSDRGSDYRAVRYLRGCGRPPNNCRCSNWPRRSSGRARRTRANGRRASKTCL